jgi:hypothetical protein
MACACPVRCNNSSVYKECAHAILDHNRCSVVASITLLSRVCWESSKFGNVDTSTLEQSLRQSEAVLLATHQAAGTNNTVFLFRWRQLRACWPRWRHPPLGTDLRGQGSNVMFFPVVCVRAVRQRTCAAVERGEWGRKL